MIEALIIQMVVSGTPIHHVQIIQDHGYYNRSVCLDLARRVRKQWEDKAEIVFIGCPDHWSET